ncbi:MAG: Alpha/beta hydrolase, partial [Caulobacteraceae bacterium]|nr:Alpha/beta hydrolase [Caulobacteraceae bacterium]
MRRSILLHLILAALASTLWSCQAPSTSAADRVLGVERVRLPDGRHIALRCSGQGSPTVIFETGFGGGSLGWSRVQPEVAKTTRTCSYDRAGYGLSDPGPMPRDGAAVARDLDKALNAAHIR